MSASRAAAKGRKKEQYATAHSVGVVKIVHKKISVKIDYMLEWAGLLSAWEIQHDYSSECFGGRPDGLDMRFDAQRGAGAMAGYR